VDQQSGLQWVHDHVSISECHVFFSSPPIFFQISKFGGDPSRVTIWGESAGAGSVLQQVIANDGATNPPLFHAAMTSSTFLPSQYAYNDIVPETIYSQTIAQTKYIFPLLVSLKAHLFKSAALMPQTRLPVYAKQMSACSSKRTFSLATRDSMVHLYMCLSWMEILSDSDLLRPLLKGKSTESVFVFKPQNHI
jgi:hypothetical protein